MSFLGNLLWILLGGFLVTLLYWIGGLILCCTIVGIPFGVQLFKIGLLALVPFGRDIETTGFASGCLGVVMNVLWILLGGIELVFVHLALALVLAITIIGLPFAKQHIKMARLALMPFGSAIS
jgi:uncharacterized membrane protein YccF (DUF307 family)